MTYYYGWGPMDAWLLTYSRLQWWYQQANRINQIKVSSYG
ncbi:Uncharacterized protein YR821_2090 [Yersinia ruckeri]|uniref:Uncharacterized protein n=1 Tax=Yersinia ruckeri TaxID=29486 RepID=A0A0A8VDP7_YERRU|nr:Uncharacterized protein YR821_2090 [Yersinia ruckeri]CEK27902.1 hypothetical protein CSF007_10760 [Yersinia ruckeri]CEK28148.1 hypothetical protein CSF007_12035 [Yersinia ruckeri]